jgi:sugar O-acyltransferase (sialic acid O-acetyltransferase NeuD family)
MKDLIILGAGGLGQEMAWLAEEINDHDREWNLLGYLDPDPATAGTAPLGYPVLASDAEAARFKGAYFVLGVGDPRLRRRIVESIGAAGHNWATLISPTTRVHPSNSLGTGVVVGRYTDMTVNCRIGNFVVLNIHVVLGHAVEVDDYSVVDPNVTINGEGRIGKECLIGANAFVRDVIVGDGVTVGAGSVVVKNVEADCVVAGVPAQVIRRGAPRHTLTKSQRTD